MSENSYIFDENCPFCVGVGFIYIKDLISYELENRPALYEWVIYVVISVNGNARYEELIRIPSEKMTEQEIDNFVISINDARDRVLYKKVKIERFLYKGAHA